MNKETFKLGDKIFIKFGDDYCKALITHINDKAIVYKMAMFGMYCWGMEQIETITEFEQRITIKQ